MSLTYSYSSKNFPGRFPFAVALVLSLSISFGVFAAGLPGEYHVTSRWRGLHNHFSPLSNPANIAEENYIAVRAAIAPVLQGAFTLVEFGVNAPLGLYHTAGYTMLVESAGAVFEDMPDPNTGRLVPDRSNAFNNANFLFSFSYAWHIWERLIIGANLNFAYQTNFGNDPLMGTGFDIGANYRALKHPLLGEHLVGLATQNLLAPTMGYSFVPDFDSDAAYARNMRFSWYSRFWENRVQNYFEFDLKDLFASAESFRASEGVDAFAKSLEWDFNWRIGYWAMRMFKAYLLFGFDDNILGHWGFALGAQIPTFNQGRDLAAYYQYNIMTEDNSDATSHSFYMKADFGLHREEAFARKMARMASVNPNELYNRGRQLYSEGRYWDAFFVFSRLMVEFPDFFRNDWVSLFRADCQEQLEMRDQSLANYNKVKEQYSGGEVVAYADLGIMRIHYRNSDFTLATNQFAELSRPNVPDSLRNHGAYIMGQIFMRNGEFRRAIHTFSTIPEEHPEYAFAQHSIAVAHAILDSEINELKVALENVMAVPPKTSEERETINRSFLLMGFVFYEENALAKAVVALRNVPPGSHYYEDALLGLGWTALKARQWGDCINIGRQLAAATQKPILRCEGLIIQAYGHMLQKEHNRALPLLQEAYNISRTLQMPSEEEMMTRQEKDADNRQTYSRMADQVESFSMMGTTAHVAGIIDSMKNRSDVYISNFHEHQRFRHEFQRGSFFSRTIEQVRDDTEYAMVTVQRIVGAAGRDQQRNIDQQRELDAEIEKLQREMEGR